MSNRRLFIAAALAAAAHHARGATEPTPEGAQDAILRVCKLYGALNSYLDITRTTIKVFGMPLAVEIRTVFAGGRLCAQEIQDGDVSFCHVIDGEHFRQWSSKKGWKELPSLYQAIESLGGSSLITGYSASWIGYLLLDARFMKDRNDLEGLRALKHATCTSASGACKSLRGVVDDNLVSLELDARTGAIKQMISESSEKRLKVVADISPRLNAPVDIHRMLNDIQRRPEQPLEVMGQGV